jgi:hypothetical protein
MVSFPPIIALGLATHGCGLLPLQLPKVREYGGERILIPEGKPKRAPRKPKRYPTSRRRRARRVAVR